jgi:hypothetical protein
LLRGFIALAWTESIIERIEDDAGEPVIPLDSTAMLV